MSDFHPLQSRIAEPSINHEDLLVFRGTTFKKDISLEYSFPAFPGISYDSYMNNFRSVGELIQMAKDEKQMVYDTIPIMLEYDRIELSISLASDNLAKARKLVLRKYFSPIISDDPNGFMVPILLSAKETGLLANGEYDYRIIFEHLGNRVGEYLNITTFGFRHLASYGKMVLR
jgi:hypothetical protein